VFDIVGLAAVGAMLFLLLGRASGNLQKLGRMEPPGVRKE